MDPKRGGVLYIKTVDSDVDKPHCWRFRTDLEFYDIVTVGICTQRCRVSHHYT